MRRVFLFALLSTVVTGRAEADQNRLPGPPSTQFTQEDIQLVSPPGLVVQVPTKCPQRNDDPEFANYPLTIARNHGGGSCASTTWTGLVSGDLWTNRCTTADCGRVKPNPISGEPLYNQQLDGQSNLPIRLPYSSVANANAATLAQLDWWLGGQHWLYWTEAAGIPDNHVYTCISDPCSDGSRAFMDDVANGTVQLQGWSKSGSRPWAFAVAVGDYVVMPVNQMVEDKSSLQTYIVQLDYERADHIGDVGTVAFLKQVSQLLQNTSPLGSSELPHTYRFNIWGDELVPTSEKGYTRTNTWKSGLDAVSIPQIMALPGFNYYSILLWSGNRFNSIQTSWEQALSVVNGGTMPQQCSPLLQNVMMAFQISNTTLQDAQTANGLMASWCVPAVEPWFNKASLGGPDCYDNEQLQWPAKWGALIGLPTSCGGGKARRPSVQPHI
ncbi:MAG TPA: hypothetical protein VGK90_10080 [Rhizomicrobium sp.]|jgi:hypothetical protein